MSHEQIQYINVSRIEVESQPRKLFRQEPLEGLAASMSESGQLQPIRVRRDGEQLFIVDGERRFRAAKRLGWEKIAVIIEEKELSNAQKRQRQLIANCQREDLTSFEKATEIEQLMKIAGWSATQVAAKLGFSNATVTKLLSLLSLPPDIRRQIEAGEIPASAGYELSQVNDPALQADMAGKLASGQMTRDALTGIRKREQTQAHVPSATSTSRVTAMLGSGRVVTLSGSGLVSLDVLIQWLEDLLAKARKVRPQGVGLPTFAKMLKDKAKRDEETGGTSHV